MIRTNSMFRKAIAFTAAFAMALSMAACGAGANDTPATTEDPIQTKTEQPAEQPEPATEEDSASESTEPTSSTEKTTINIAALKGPTAVGMLQLMENNDAGTAANDYNFTLAGAPDEIVGKIVSGELDIAAVPTNLGATLFNKTKGGVQLAALNTMGVLYILEKGDTIQSVADLEGKTIYATGQGSTPEYALNLVLAANGLTPGENVTIEYKTEHSEIPPLMASGEATIALLPQPFVTSVQMKQSDVRVALDLTKEWDTAVDGKSGLTMGAVIVRKEFAEQNKEAVDQFLDEYKSSTQSATDAQSLEHIADLAAQYDVMAKEIAEKAIPECNIVFVEGDEMQTIASGFFQVLYDANPQSIGGTIPDESFYYKK